MVIITQGPDGGIAVNNSTLTIPEENALAQHYVADIQIGNYGKAVPALASAVAGKIDAKERFWPNIFLTLFLVALVIVAFILIRRGQNKKTSMDQFARAARSVDAEHTRGISSMSMAIPASCRRTTQIPIR